MNVIAKVEAHATTREKQDVNLGESRVNEAQDLRGCTAIFLGNAKQE